LKRHKYHYGDDPSQWGELFLPEVAEPRGVVVVIHGGYWRSQYGAELGEPLARDLAAHGTAAWNLEYRRAGNGGGWPRTFADVLAGIDKLRDIAGEHGLGLDKVGDGEVHLTGVISQSGVLNLADAERLNLSNGAVSNLMGGSSDKYPKRHKYADPMSALPLRIPVYAVHGTEDDTVPLSQSEAYVGAAKAAGAPVQLLKVPGDHFALIDPKAAAYRKCRELVQSLLS
jgi:acetyl esterase/lipase